MTTLQFLRGVLPTEGHYILAIFSPARKYPAHKVFSSLEQMARAAAHYDSKGYQVFHAVASYANPKGVWNERKEKHQLRVKDNVAFIRAQWLDIDVGPGKDYASRKEALTSLLAVCKELGIPAPMIVKSGKGLHCYWRFNRDIPAQEAALCAAAFSAALKGVGFRHDPKPTKNLACVLRPAGTHHRKGDPIEVKVLREADEVDPDQFYARFSKYQAPKPLVIQGLQDDWGSGTDSFPPSSAKHIVKQCSALQRFAFHSKDKPPLPEDFWRGMLGLLHFTVEGDKLGHLWSSKSDARYSEGETQDKIDGWGGGPTTCEYFSDHNPSCAKCPHWNKIKSPISLGYSEDAPPPRKEEPEQTIIATDSTVVPVQQQINNHACQLPDNQSIPFWPKGYSWDGSQLQKFVKDETGAGEWVPFSNTLYYPFMRFETEDRTRAMMVCALTDPKKGIWRTFELDTAKAADARTLATALGAQEIVYMHHSKDRNQKFVQDVLHGIRAHSLETVTYNTFGWHDHGFVIGESMITRKKPTAVFLGSRVPRDLHGDFGVSGTASEWSDLVDAIYNRAGAEPYQFVICCALAAVLVKLCESDMWHGIPVGVTGGGGEGKTTICKVACSIFGNPRKMMIQANDEGTTINALIQRIATMGNLPMLLDEITGRETQELQSILFALSNGEPKRRLRPDGTEVNAGQSWDTVAFITGNLSITNMLAQSDRVKADASQVRCFEIALEDGYNRRVFGDINGKEDIEHKLLNKNFGAVGREFLRYVAKHRDKVTNELQKQRAQMASNLESSDSKERFYYDLIATAMVGAGIAKKLGIIHFDLKALRKWALNHVLDMRKMRSSSLSTPEDYLQDLLGHLHQHTVLTKYYRDGREKPPGPENIITPFKEPLARHATEDKRFIITATAYNQWCLENKVNKDWLFTNLEKEGYMLHEPVGGPRQRLFKGTGLGSVQARCFEFNYEKLDESKLQLPDYMSVVDEGNKPSDSNVDKG